jgi:biopolymer transport protein ExbD
MNFAKKIEQPTIGMLIAPMVDMMFLLLIFFMLAGVLAQRETKVGITVPPSITGLAGGRQSKEIIINIDKNGAIEINSAQFKNAEDLKTMLLNSIADAINADASRRIIVRADRETRHEAVMSVLDACRQAGIINIGFATLPPSTVPK